MSTMGQTQQSQGMGQSQNIGSPISNEAYNVLTTLQSKLKGLETYRQFAQTGGNPQVWQYLNQIDTQAVQFLTQELERLVQGGQFRPRQPGQMMGQQSQMGQPGPVV